MDQNTAVFAPTPAATDAGDSWFGDAEGRADWRRGALRISWGWRLRLIAQGLDLFAIIAVSLGAYASNGAAGATFPERYLVGSLTVAIACCLCFMQADLYELDLLFDPPRLVKALFLRWTLVFLMVGTLTALLREQDAFSRSWFVKFYLGGICAIYLERWAVRRLVSALVRRGYSTRTVALVGANELARQLMARLRRNQCGIRVVGVFDERRPEDDPGRAGFERVGGIQDLLDYARGHVVDLVVITLPITATERVAAVIGQLRQQPLNVRLLPGAIGLERVSPIRLPRTELPGVQLIAVADQPIPEFELFLKGAMDRLLAAVLLLVLAPVLLFCAAGIAISSPGPIFFRQQRVGYKNRVFTILKFRTMRPDHGAELVTTRRGDPRVFAFGRLLRRTSLDELPQLFNVLKGDMSLVGPRPIVHAEIELYADKIADYYRCRPGITGLWQVSGRNLISYERRVELDSIYAKKQSLRFDLNILIRTVLVVISRRGAL